MARTSTSLTESDIMSYEKYRGLTFRTLYCRQYEKEGLVCLAYPANLFGFRDLDYRIEGLVLVSYLAFATLTLG